MKKLGALAVAAVAALAMTACTTVSPVCASSATVGAKTGEATRSVLLGFIPLPFNSDTGIAAAAKNGGITKVATVDVKVQNLVFMTKITTVVTGE